MHSISFLLNNTCLTRAHVSQTPTLDAEILLAYALNKTRSFLYAWPAYELTQEEEDLFQHFLERRLKGEPIAYIIGQKEFWSMPLYVNSHTLIPRVETELLVECILNLNLPPRVKVADFGTGCGAIAVALAKEKPDWHIVALDCCEKALAVASSNVAHFSLSNVSLQQSHWAQSLKENNFDIIVSNPPYIAEKEWEVYADGLAYEPKGALLSGIEGLDAIREISKIAKHYLLTGAYLIIEHGYQQAKKVRDIFWEDGYKAVSTVCDGEGRERVTIARYFCAEK